MSKETEFLGVEVSKLKIFDEKIKMEIMVLLFKSKLMRNALIVKYDLWLLLRNYE